MITKLHRILIGLLVLQVGLAALLLSRRGDQGVLRDHPLLPGFDAAKVTRLQVFATDPKPIDIVKKGTGWVLASSFDYPADTTKVTDILGPIAKLAAAEPIATQSSRHKQLKVADTDFNRKLVITADGKDITLFLGGQASARRSAVRIGGSDEVYGVTGISSFSAGAEPHMWVDPHYTMIPKAEIAKVTVQRGAETIEFTRGADEAWSATVDGATIPADQLDKEAVDHAVDEIATVDLLAPADPKRDASKPTATIAVEMKTKPGTSTAAIMFDVIADGERFWIHHRALDRAVVVDKSRMDLAVIDRTKLVKPPPAPGAGSGSAAPK